MLLKFIITLKTKLWYTQTISKIGPIQSVKLTKFFQGIQEIANII